MSDAAELLVESWDVADLTPYDDNAKIHDEAQVEKLATAIRSTGWDQPIVVDKDGVIIKGHGRRLAAIHLGLKKVPVVVRRDLTELQVKEARLSDNRVAVGDVDEELLKKELAALNEMEVDLTNMGFDEEELSFLVEDVDLDGLLDDLDAESDAATETTAKPSSNIKEEDYKPAFQVIVECTDEADQEKVYGQMAEQGYKCRVLSL